jgi:hypothetical protein
MSVLTVCLSHAISSMTLWLGGSPDAAAAVLMDPLPSEAAGSFAKMLVLEVCQAKSSLRVFVLPLLCHRGTANFHVNSVINSWSSMSLHSRAALLGPAISSLALFRA